MPALLQQLWSLFRGPSLGLRRLFNGLGVGLRSVAERCNRLTATERVTDQRDDPWR